MSLTSYRAAPPRVSWVVVEEVFLSAFCRPGSDLLSRVLRQSTIGAGGFHGRVRDGIGCWPPAGATRPAKRRYEELVFSADADRCFLCVSLSIEGRDGPEVRKRDARRPVRPPSRRAAPVSGKELRAGGPQGRVPPRLMPRVVRRTAR